MLTTHLLKSPPTKFILIEDSVEVQSAKLLNFVVNYHTNQRKYNIHYLVTEGNVKRIKSNYGASKITFYDLTTNTENLGDILMNISDNAIVIINSLCHLMFDYTANKLMNILNTIKQQENVIQIITILHQDIIDDASTICPFYEYLSTLTMELMFINKSSKPRVLYKYKKSSGKIEKQYEEYCFLPNGSFSSNPIKKLDPKELIQENMKATLPENLTTFKISLEDKEKQERDKLVLPYLPKENECGETPGGGGQILYQLEDADDWDPEDPDDDLDF